MHTGLRYVYSAVFWILGTAFFILVHVCSPVLKGIDMDSYLLTLVGKHWLELAYLLSLGEMCSATGTVHIMLFSGR